MANTHLHKQDKGEGIEVEFVKFRSAREEISEAIIANREVAISLVPAVSASTASTTASTIFTTSCRHLINNKIDGAYLQYMADRYIVS